MLLFAQFVAAIQSSYSASGTTICNPLLLYGIVVLVLLASAGTLVASRKSINFSAVQPENVYVPIFVVDAPNVIFCKAVSPEHAYCPVRFTDLASEKSTSVSAVQSANW